MLRQIKALRVLLPSGLTWRKVLGTAVVAGLLALAFFCGQWFGTSPVGANPPAARSHSDALNIPANLVRAHQGNPSHPVAYIYNGQPVTRQDLGEYLIARLGPQRVEFMVNRRIIELECHKRGISISDTEVEQQLIEDLKLMNVPSLEAFVGSVLKRVGKTLYEYQEDVIRPKLALRKLCEDRIQVTLKDLQDAFEVKYGPKVECRIIVFSAEQGRDVSKIWTALRKEPRSFVEYAQKLNFGELATRGGLVPPIHKHFPDQRIEKAAFRLKEGEISEVIELQDGSRVIMQCERHIPAITNRKLVVEERELRREVHEHKLLEEMPKYFNELKRQARTNIVLPQDDLDKSLAQRVNRALQKASQMRIQAAEKNLPMPPENVRPSPPLGSGALESLPTPPPQFQSAAPAAAPEQLSLPPSNAAPAAPVPDFPLAAPPVPPVPDGK